MFRRQLLSKIQKELLIGGIHSAAAILDIMTLRKRGYKIIELAKEYPGVVLLGACVGSLYFRFITRMIEKTS